MEGLQTTEADETTLDFGGSDSEEEGSLNGSKKKDRKELFQINTHPSTVLVANNKRDRRLKQIVMRVVAFCKKEHEEGQQVPFRFFKKRASLMTGVSLSTIHRIETIDMKAPPASPPQPQSGAPAGKSRPKTKDGQKKKLTALNKKKKKRRKKHEVCEGAARVVSGTAASSSSLVPQNHGLEGSTHDPSNLHLHFQISAATHGNPAPVAAASPAPRRKKTKVKTAARASDPGRGGVMILHNQHTHSSAAPTPTPSTAAIITTLQPAAMHAAVGVGGEGVVTTINVHNAVAVNPQQHPAACAWTTTAGPIGPFALGELRDGGGHPHPHHHPHQLQLPVATTHHLQVHGQHVQAVSTALPALGAQLQPISVAAAVSQQAAGFAAGHVVDSVGLKWESAAGVGGMPGAAAVFGTLPGAATLVGQQMVQTYHHNPHPHPPPPQGHTLTTVTATTPHQQPPQPSPVFYHQF